MRFLLIRAHDPNGPGHEHWWELPGGGIDPGEPSAQTCIRELDEEVGIRTATIGPVVWTQHCRFDFAGLRFDQHEVIHVALCEPNPPLGSTRLESLEKLAFEAVRWWSADELIASTDRTLPPTLRTLLPGALRVLPPHDQLSMRSFATDIDPLDITDERDWTW